MEIIKSKIRSILKDIETQPIEVKMDWKRHVHELYIVAGPHVFTELYVVYSLPADSLSSQPRLTQEETSVHRKMNSIKPKV
jgi:hypothetical protein